MSDLLKPNWTPEMLVILADRRSRLNIAGAVINARVRLGMTQADLAKAAGTTQCRVSQLEDLKGNPRFDTLDRVSRALGLEVDLVERKPEPRQRGESNGN